MANYSLYAEQSDAAISCIEYVLNYHNGATDEPIIIFSANAGSGKTYTANVIARVLSKFGFNGTAMAFTGKAVTQLQKSGIPARTFHSLMYRPKLDKDGEIVDWEMRGHDELVAEAGSYILLDEGSMITEKMIDELSTLKLPIIAVGDVAQLPPIDNNNPDFNLMTSFLEYSPVIELEVNRRTAPEYAGITMLCEHFRTNEVIPNVKGSGLTWLKKKDLTEDFFKEHHFDGVIVGTNKNRKKYTDIIRSARGHNDHVANVGETVMCLQNAYVDNVYIANGEVFKVEAMFDRGRHGTFTLRSVDNHNKLVNVNVFHDFWVTEKMPRLHPKEAMKYQQFTFGYVATCWKWQGSSLDDVLFIDEYVDWNGMGIQKNFRYTAVSRAAKNLFYAK